MNNIAAVNQNFVLWRYCWSSDAFCFFD